MLTRLARFPRVCITVPVRSFAKKPRQSKVDEVEKNIGAGKLVHLNNR